MLGARLDMTDRTLLSEARTDDELGPLVKVVPPAANAEERFRSLKVMRPRFRVPERILTFGWPRHASSLAEAGLWDHLSRPLVALGRREHASTRDEEDDKLVEKEGRVEAASRVA